MHALQSDAVEIKSDQISVRRIYCNTLYSSLWPKISTKLGPGWLWQGRTPLVIQTGRKSGRNHTQQGSTASAQVVRLQWPTWSLYKVQFDKNAHLGYKSPPVAWLYGVQSIKHSWGTKIIYSRNWLVMVQLPLLCMLFNLPLEFHAQASDSAAVIAAQAVVLRLAEMPSYLSYILHMGFLDRCCFFLSLLGNFLH